MPKLHKITLVLTLVLYLIGCGGGGGSDGAVNFPNPSLPAGATKINAGNAETIANSALEFTGTLVAFAAKADEPPSISQIINRLADQAVIRNRNPGSVTAGKTDDVSSEFCVAGTATNTYTETATSVSGQILFSNCNIGFGILINGNFPYQGSWNDATLDYSFQFGGTLTFDDGTDLIAIVLNFHEAGNDGTGTYYLTPSFSLAGIPGGNYLVTTVQPLVGNYFTGEITGGELNVQGADNTYLCMAVSAIDTITVEFDDGLGGGCAPLAPALVITI